jgi:dihydroorotase
MKEIFNLPQSANGDKTIIFNVRILDSYSKYDEKGSVLIENGKILDFGPHIKEKEVSKDFKRIDGKGNLLTPGLLDIQVHFRTPGFEFKETIEAGSKSAVAGGVTTVVCMPNTKPVLDEPYLIEYLLNKAQKESYCNLEIYGAISKNMEGKQLSDLSLLKQAGVCGFTDDGLPVMNAFLMRKAFEYSAQLNLPVAQHAEDLNLTNKGAINEGKVSYELGISGIPNASESVIVARDIEILKLTGGSYHLLHASTKESIELIQKAKALGLDATCEVAPHHFLLNEEAVLKHGTNAKMNPPLRAESDRKALEAALIDGTIDVIATDHAPHDETSKNKPLQEASFGIIGVQQMLSLSLELYHQKKISLIDLFAKMTCNPAKIIRRDRGKIKKGAVADLTLIDLEKSFVIDIKNIHSKSKNTPFIGKKVKGRVVKTFVAGSLVYAYDE